METYQHKKLTRIANHQSRRPSIMAAYICNFTAARQIATLSAIQWMAKLDRVGPTRYTQLSLAMNLFNLILRLSYCV